MFFLCYDYYCDSAPDVAIDVTGSHPRAGSSLPLYKDTIVIRSVSVLVPSP